MLEINPFQIKDEQEFNACSLKIFHHQASHCDTYRAFLENLSRPVPSHYSEIPFLPISAFKNHQVYAGNQAAETVFESSGTTGMKPSKHAIKDLLLYERCFMSHFSARYGAPEQWCILALLPSYLERGNSSLVYMVDHLIKRSLNDSSGFFLNNHDALRKRLDDLRATGQKVMLIGVSFALLDLLGKGPIPFPELVVMETGGMKGRKKEILREELHSILKRGFSVNAVHSEYGMTELLSQAYAPKDGMFYCPPWMKVLVRELNDPFQPARLGASGAMNIIDLANIHSCSFIATEDLGRSFEDGGFEVLGRYDHSDMRGCSLMV